MRTTKIEWTDKTWNPITGCTKHSAGCAHCYAEVMSRRLHANGFRLTMHEVALNEPKSWKKPHVIFVCSMSDLFHADVTFEFIDKIMDTIRATPQHRYQLLTKHPLAQICNLCQTN
jgi:protein gp37